MFDFGTLITDRTLDDVLYLSALLSKPFPDWTEEEREAFNTGALKGGYCWTDLNRVTSCMEYLDEELRKLGYDSGYVSTMEPWDKNGAPTKSDLSLYLSNVSKIRSIFEIVEKNSDPLPDGKNLTADQANNIEKILGLTSDTVDGIKKTFPRSGVYYSNGVLYLPDQSYGWEIVQEPKQVETLVYTGGEISPNWGVDTDKFVITGGSAVDSGDYVAAFKPKEGYKWPDESTAAKSFPWRMEKAQGVLSVPPTLTMNKQNWQDTIEIQYNGDGEVSASASNAGVIINVSGNVVSVMSVLIGETTITVSATEGRNYTAPGSAQCVITVTDIILSEPASGTQYSGAVRYIPDIYR